MCQYATVCLIGVATLLVPTSPSPLWEVPEGNATTFGNIAGFYVPTVRSKESGCRNASLYYLSELGEFKVWATEMFDSTTKFPSGILSGNNYDFGDFDECLGVKIPYRGSDLYGKYCLARITFDHPSGANEANGEQDSIEYNNTSIWRMIKDYSKDVSRRPRNEAHFAFCLPSECSGKDLRDGLEEMANESLVKSGPEFSVQVDERSCQKYEKTELDTGDKIFIFVVILAVMSAVIGSVYDLFTRRDDFAHYRLPGKLHQSLHCFSFMRNFTKLTTVDGEMDGMNCLSGMKVYSMVLIILLHRLMFSMGSAIANPSFAEQMYGRFEMTFLLNGPLLVDTFFTLSGYLATYLILHQYHRKADAFNVAISYFHRYVRMIPTYAVILGFYCTLLVKLGSGPLWQSIIGLEREKCRKSWWTNVLFVNNYIDTKNYCMFQSWYVACDMNAFIFVPLLCLVLTKRPSLGLSLVALLILASVAVVFVTVFVYDESPILLVYLNMLLKPNEDSTFLRVYIPGHMRMTPYFVGVLTAYAKYQMKLRDHKLPKAVVRAGWALCFPVMFICLYSGYIFYAQRVPAFFSALYACLHHLGWGAAIAWIVVSVSSGHGPWVKSILSWPPLVVLSRLSYTVYLCHGVIQLFTVSAIRQPNHVSYSGMMHATAADIILAYVLAFVLTILFESPVVRLEKVFLRPESGKKQKEVETTTELTQL